MRDLVKLFLMGLTYFFVLLFSLSSFAFGNCSPQHLAQFPQMVLRCYLAIDDAITQPLTLIEQKYDNHYQVEIKKYILRSQMWPHSSLVGEKPKIWEHGLTIYQPAVLSFAQALLFVNNGTRFSYPNLKVQAPFSFNFSRIAAKTNTIVIELQDVPNQYLRLGQKPPAQEDDLVAYTFAQYLKNHKQAYWPLYLPMTKAIIKALDATQGLLNKQGHRIDHFILAGISKRGWSAWLATLHDARITGLIPIVAEVVDIKSTLKNIQTKYQYQWPPALAPYVRYSIFDQLDSSSFNKLLDIIDPFRYISPLDGTCDRECATYRKRLSIPKYLISAANDAFFPVDSNRFFWAKLPSTTQLRIIPNQGHRIDSLILEDALLTYYDLLLKPNPLPDIHWSEKNGQLYQVVTSAKPIEVKVWEALFPSADFRLNINVPYTSKVINPAYCKIISASSPASPIEISMRERSHISCVYDSGITPPGSAGKASFMEITFKQPLGGQLILTTPAYVISSFFKKLSE